MQECPILFPLARVTVRHVASETAPSSTVIKAAREAPLSRTIALEYSRSRMPCQFLGSSFSDGVTSTLAAPALKEEGAKALRQSGLWQARCENHR